jgi:hypothetical protein
MKDQVTSIERPLRLVNGKFMRGDVEVKPEIGNPEQIALLQKIERERIQREKAANDGRLDVYIHVEDIKYKVVCEFTCICGNGIQARGINYTDDWEELGDPVYEDGPIICDKCYREYEIDGLHAKLIKR